MTAKKPVTLANLEALGARRLAGILLELADEDAGIKRRLRLELSAANGAEAVAGNIGKRLATIRQARSFIDGPKRRAFVRDLDLQRQLIVERVTDSRPDLALELMWRFMELAEPVLERSREIDGNLYFLLDPAAKALEGEQPLAATLLRRVMIEDTLAGAKARRYRHAARHLLECRSLAASIGDHGGFETHEAFVARLREQHGRKAGFWSQVTERNGASNSR
jgi:hypothetical protein